MRLNEAHAVVIASYRFAIDDARGARKPANVSTISGKRWVKA